MLSKYSDDGDMHSTKKRLSPANRLPPELWMYILSLVGGSSSLVRCALVCKAWCRCAVEQLWFRPAILTMTNLQLINRTLNTPSDACLFTYSDFIRRLNLGLVANDVSDVDLYGFLQCSHIERMTLSNCRHLSADFVKVMISRNVHLQALDLLNIVDVNDITVLEIAEKCKRLQGLNLSGCTSVTDTSIKILARNCRNIRRIKLNECQELTDESVKALASGCKNLIEVDLHACLKVTNTGITALYSRLNHLREIRLALDVGITDHAFKDLPNGAIYERLRIVDLTGCLLITDETVMHIVDKSPRIRNLILAKCVNITDQGIIYLSRLGRNLHYLHMGHCNEITDYGIEYLVRWCCRIRYIDLACCSRLTDTAVVELSTLPKLRRIGLVKCLNITDEAIYALVRKKGAENCLERVHLSYCSRLTLPAIVDLINSCPKLTHLSLTGVTSFLNRELTQFCRPPPPEFNQHQQSLFCVYSGNGIIRLRNYLNMVAAQQLRLFTSGGGQASLLDFTTTITSPLNDNNNNITISHPSSFIDTRNITPDAEDEAPSEGNEEEQDQRHIGSLIGPPRRGVFRRASLSILRNIMNEREDAFTDGEED